MGFNLFRTFKKASSIERVFYISSIVVIIIIIVNFTRPVQESFSGKKNFTTNSNITDIYDDFYVSVYDDLLFNQNKNSYEIGEIINSSKPRANSRVLDIGSGTGHHVDILSKRGYKTTGIDISPAMIKKAKQNHPSCQFKKEDALDTMIFQPNIFSLITCLYFTIYYIKEKRQFFKNCMRWLEPGGKLAIHLVDRNKFDPIVPAGDPLVIVSAQTYAKERITSTSVEFDTHSYESNFELKDNNMARHHEIFKNKKTGDIRENEHKLYMSTQKEILTDAKAAGFILLTKIDLVHCEYDNQYIYILQKPN